MPSISLKVAAPATQRESEGVEAFREGPDLIRKLVSDKENIVISPEAFYLLYSHGAGGFIHDFHTEYKEFSVIRKRPGAEFFVNVDLTNKRTGRYYPAFIMYDRQGEPDQVVTIFVDNERKGVAVARNHDNRSYVFVLSEPCVFKGGETIALMTPGTPGGNYRIEKILLLKKKPKVDREYLFTDVNAVPFDYEDGVKARVTWITNWATPSRVEYGPSTEYGQSVEDEEAPFSGPPSTSISPYTADYVPTSKSIYNNHRLVLAGLKSGRTYHYRLRGRTLDGVEVTSQDYTFTTSPKKKPKGRVEREIITLHVKNKLPVRREKWPVTSGVPFPKGALGSPENVRLLNPIGEEVPFQASVLSEWADGSVKWLLMDFQADVESRSVAEYKLEFGRKVLRQEKKPKLRIIITRKGSTVVVNTGPLRLLFNADNPSFPGRVWLDLNEDGVFSTEEEITDPDSPGVMELVDTSGKAYTSLRGPCRVEIEEEGPLRTLVKLVGEHQAEDGSSLFTYVTRINAYAGKNFLKVFHTWENSHLEEDFTTIKSLILKTPLRMKRPVCTLLGNDERVYRSNGEPILSQNLDDEYTVEEGDIIKRHGKRAKGLIDLSDGEWGLTVGVRDFWQNYPKSLGVEGRAVVVGICSPIPEDLYPPVEELEDKLYYYLLNGQYKLKQGVSKTHELLYYFHVGDFEKTSFENCIRLLQEPLLATAPPEWYCDSKAFGDVAMVDKVKFPHYEEYVNKDFENYLKTREQGKEYGMLNFGDWYQNTVWGNMEYDTSHVFLLQYIRSGDLRFFKAGEEAARHYMDIDTCHHNRDKISVGTVYRHCLGHVGGYYPSQARGLSQGAAWVCHTWTQGLLDYYFLTGYKRSLETTKKIADKYAKYHTVNYDFSNCRIPGWHLIHTVAMYQATDDEFYLNAAKIIVRRVLERQSPSIGGWMRQMHPGHCHCIPRHRGNAGFMVGILLSGLKLYHLATGDKSVADSIVKGAEFLIKDLWIPEVNGFRYTSCPKSHIGNHRNTLILEGPSYAYRLSGKELFKNVVLTGIKAADYKSYADAGKGISERTRVAPHILYDIENYMM